GVAPDDQRAPHDAVLRIVFFIGSERRAPGINRADAVADLVVDVGCRQLLALADLARHGLYQAGRRLLGGGGVAVAVGHRDDIARLVVGERRGVPVAIGEGGDAAEPIVLALLDEKGSIAIGQRPGRAGDVAVLVVLPRGGEGAIERLA